MQRDLNIFDGTLMIRLISDNLLAQLLWANDSVILVLHLCRFLKLYTAQGRFFLRNLAQIVDLATTAMAICIGYKPLEKFVTILKHRRIFYIAYKVSRQGYNFVANFTWWSKLPIIYKNDLFNTLALYVGGQMVKTHSHCSVYRTLEV